MMNIIIKGTVYSIFAAFIALAALVRNLSSLIAISIVFGSLACLMILISDTLESATGPASPMSPPRSSKRDNSMEIITFFLITVCSISIIRSYIKWNDLAQSKIISTQHNEIAVEEKSANKDISKDIKADEPKERPKFVSSKSKKPKPISKISANK